jgi:glycerate kinase
MKILIAPDKFKGSLSAREVADNIELGLRDVLRDAEIAIAPMADGGEGTAEVICNALGGSWVKCTAHDALGREIDARYAWIANRNLAVMEMSEAAGMRRIAESERNPVRTTTFGVGEMISDAANRGAGEIILGLGGSATNDGGFGMARALGFLFFSGEDELSGAVTELQKLTRIVAPSPDTSRPLLTKGEDRGEGKSSSVVHPLSQITIIAAVDVRNPLLGENGATRVFGPQKGASEDEIDILERALTRLADVVAEKSGFDYRDEPGTGAAGGLGFGLMSFCGAQTRSGFEVVAEAVNLESKVENADVVITGEGSLDRQTLEGKTPAGVARLARKLGKRVFAFVGHATNDPEVREIFEVVYENIRPRMSEEDNMKRAAELLRENARELAKIL